MSPGQPTQSRDLNGSSKSKSSAMPSRLLVIFGDILGFALAESRSEVYVVSIAQLYPFLNPGLEF
jgi:hypothetical protein